MTLLPKAFILFLAVIGLYWLFSLTCFSGNETISGLRAYVGVERGCEFVKVNQL